MTAKPRQASLPKEASPRPDGALLEEPPVRRKRYGDAISGPYAEMVCRDCGAKGCLVPVPHNKKLCPGCGEACAHGFCGRCERVLL